MNVLTDKQVKFLNDTCDTAWDKEQWESEMKDGKVNINREVMVYKFEGKELPVKFGVTGKFTIRDCDNLITLEGMPDVVNGKCSIINMKSINDLEHTPEANELYVSACDIKTTKGIKCTSMISISFCRKLERLENSELSCKSFMLHYLPIKTLEGCPDNVSHRVVINECENLSSLEKSPAHIGDFFSVINCKKLNSAFGATKGVSKYDIELTRPSKEEKSIMDEGFIEAWLASDLSAVDFIKKKRGHFVSKKFGF